MVWMAIKRFLRVIVFAGLPLLINWVAGLHIDPMWLALITAVLAAVDKWVREWWRTED